MTPTGSGVAEPGADPAMLRGVIEAAHPPMIPVLSGSRVWLATGHTDMRKGFDGLVTLVQVHLRGDPFSGRVFVFRGRAGRLIKVLWWDGQGMCLFSKRLKKGRFVWPATAGAAAALTPA